MGIIASTAFRPVCSGSFTGWRKITPGAFLSSGISYLVPPMGPLPSSGSPSGLMTRPIMSMPTWMLAMRPVRRTVSPSSTISVGPSSTAPTLSSSRFITMASSPLSNWSSSLASALLRPKIRTTPSLTCSTVPISSTCASEAMPSSCSWRMAVTSLTFILSFIFFSSYIN